MNEIENIFLLSIYILYTNTYTDFHVIDFDRFVNVSELIEWIFFFFFHNLTNM